MTIAILALQGAFAEHQQMLSRLGVASTLIRNLDDWNTYLADAPQTGFQGKGLIIPGGESTTMTRILHDQNMWEPLRDAIRGGLPTFGTCAGLILLDSEHLGVMNITARRNAYGRQLGSFHAQGHFGDTAVPMTFIRAPYIETAGDGVEVLTVHEGRMVAARQANMLVTAFHPELDTDTAVHQYFLRML